MAYLSFGTQKGGYETDGRMVQTGFLDSNGLAVGADGSFEIVLSARQHEGNWVRMEAGTNALVVRQTFMDRKAETPAELRIERLHGADKPPVLDAERLHGGLLRAAGFVESTARIFADWAQGYGGHVNALPPADQAYARRQAAIPTSSTTTPAGHWRTTKRWWSRWTGCRLAMSGTSRSTTTGWSRSTTATTTSA